MRVKIPRQDAASLFKSLQDASGAAGRGKAGTPTERTGKAGAQDPSASAAKGTTGRKDRLDISSEAQALQRFLKAVEQSPDVREERVEAIRQAIQAGTYRVSGKQIVDKILHERGKGIVNREQGGSE